MSLRASSSADGVRVLCPPTAVAANPVVRTRSVAVGVCQDGPQAANSASTRVTCITT